ncbi:hypothetical protein BMW24_017675 [Mycobacterium heckeshornense]|uniref:Uncharacterized protein n=2 Tax=Mycobacterium heckeshornense TaxID=110505 RepID=A0A2G8B425_9MYCO|nr:hypothetical protein [Mycobacterium heckeshornense]MCV7034811.1 hypothetical protein [Mycobacterium heckeshornense]PIJ32501.1 hypothetical protein BMW24_017675 [Mycobacterium heckeshornense]BCO36724.1 hypothetical protein MHEC_31570 [Mycobacterium heckeshornense]
MSGNESESELWRAALEEHLAGLSAADFAALVARTRPPGDFADLPPGDVTARHRRITESLTAKAAQLRSLPRDADGPLAQGRSR